MSGPTWRVAGALVLVTAVAGVIGVVPTRSAGAYVERVGMSGMRFDPARLQIQTGDTVIWEAEDDGHTVTARDGSFDSSSRGSMVEGDQFRWRFRVPGTYAYYCRVHHNRGMQGEVVVVDPYAATTTTRLTPVTAAATTSTTAAAATTETTLPVTTTSRELATSSTTSLKQITSATVPAGTPVVPQEPPAVNPNAPVLSGTGSAVLPETQAAARRSAEEKDDLGPAIALGVVGALLVAAGGGAALRARSRRRRSPAG